MQQSSPGKSLQHPLKAVIEPIYKSDPVRYRRLIHWVWFNQKQGWPDEALIEAIKLAGPNIHKANNWWKLLTFLLPKAKGRASEHESYVHKVEIRETTQQFLDFLKLRAQGKI